MKRSEDLKLKSCLSLFNFDTFPVFGYFRVYSCLLEVIIAGHLSFADALHLELEQVKEIVFEELVFRCTSLYLLFLSPYSNHQAVPSFLSDVVISMRAPFSSEPLSSFSSSFFYFLHKIHFLIFKNEQKKEKQSAFMGKFCLSGILFLEINLTASN